MKSHRNKIFFPLSHLSPAMRMGIALSPIVLLIVLKPFYPPFLIEAPIALHFPLLLVATWLGGGITGFIGLALSLSSIFFYVKPDLLGELHTDSALLVRFLMFIICTVAFLSIVTALEKALLRAEKAIKERDEFLTTISHELRTPITAMKLNLEVVKEQLKDYGITLPSIDAIQRQVSRQAKLISSMLDLAMIDSGDLGLKIEKWDLQEITEKAAILASETLNDDDVKLNLVPAFVRCDRKRIEQVIYNLVHNAIKYGDRNSVEVLLRTDDKNALIEIVNSGTVIPEKNHSNIFKKMMRPIQPNQVQGLGVGLYLARHLVELHQGKIELSSHQNKTIFTVKLPLELTA